MVSTLKLTKIQIPNSDSDVISLDASSGNVTLNKTLGGTSITVQGEGTATTNLQQGLAKAWAYIDGTGTVALRESFNIGSLTDNGTGNYTTNLTNSMSSANYSIPSGGHYYPVSNPISQGESHQTFPMDSNTIQSNTGNGSNFQDNEGPAHSVFGDLA